jgi:hypothetical protein
VTLREKRVLFTRLLCEFVLWCNEQPGWEVALDEGTVHSPRLSWLQGAKVRLPDGVHKPGSAHHDGLGQDILLYIDGVYIGSSEHPAYRQIARKWESMHPRCTSGIRWSDANHVSFDEGSKETPLP